MNRRKLLAYLSLGAVTTGATGAALAGAERSRKPRSLQHVYLSGFPGDPIFEDGWINLCRPLVRNGYEVLSHSMTPDGVSFIFVRRAAA